MSLHTAGLHHVTAIAGDAQRNAEFYVSTLGLRLVKRTINYDDPKTYHLYYGDGKGTPGTNVTFFPWTGSAQRGQFGTGQTKTTAYTIRPESLEFWSDRLESKGIDVDRTRRFDDTVLQFTDPDGINLELVASSTDEFTTPWEDGPVPREHQLRGLHSVTLAVRKFIPTASVLTDVLGYELAAKSANRRRYRSQSDTIGTVVDLVETDIGPGRMGIGTVHHVAFKAADAEEQKRWREAFLDHGVDVTRVIDRTYFRSIYAREPGGILFEVATNGPGFTVDENADELGQQLALPEWMESDRREITESLPEFEHPREQSDPN